MGQDSPGAAFRGLLREGRALPVPGVFNPISALLAEDVGFDALYMSGAGTVNGTLGLPDIGLGSRTEFTDNARRITAVTDRPLICDADAGFGNALAVERTVAEFERAGVAGIHIEDQVEPKRCGHVEGKEVVEPAEMVQKVRAAVNARRDPDFVVIARVDAVAVEGFEAGLERAHAYAEAGADVIFAEALERAEDFASFAERGPDVPLLANMTEFGRTPYLSAEEFAALGWQIVIYPLTAFRAMLATMRTVYREIRDTGSQREVLDAMMSREDLYRLLDYDGVVARDRGYRSE